MDDSERMAIESRNDELLDRARNVIRELREKLMAAEARTSSEPIAIIGMAGRFPGSGASLDAFWRMIVEGRDAVRSIPAERWDRDAFYAPEAAVPGKMNTRHAAFLDDVARFDASFFDVTPREAVTMDPQQRIFLETAWHALEDAGLTRAMLSGSDTGVFVGVHSHSTDYCAMQFADPAALDGYAATGSAHDMIAGRLAYWLDLRGPSLVVNTACSSSLVAVHLACRSLRSGESSSAVVGGINLLLLPTSGVAMSQLQMLAGDGHSKTFDARADGFGRGEGCGVVILKRLSDAVRDGDRVLALIRGSAMNQDGRTNGLTAPSGLAQQRLLRRALEDAGVSPSQVGYFEAHGTGTALGDPIEVEAIAAVLGGEQRRFPCVLGSIKANIGHLEGGAGIAGLIKSVLVLRHGYLPPVANLEQLNPHLALSGSGLTIPNSGRIWPRDGRRFAGVSSFGWSGANAHVVLEEAPEEPLERESAPGPVVVAVSGQTSAALQAMAAAYAEWIEGAAKHELADISYSSAMRRTHHAERIAVIGHDGRELATQLRRRAAGGHAPAAGQLVLRLKQLAELFEQGVEIDWKEIYPTHGKVVSLPQYPFQGKRYWLKSATAADSSIAESMRQAPGFTVQAGASNLSDEAQVYRLFSDIARSDAPLYGVIHAPAAVSFGAAAEMLNPERSPAEAEIPLAKINEGEGATGLVTELRALSERDRFERLLTFISRETKEVFGMPQSEPLDENRGLVEMGMDSLMAVILQNELQAAFGVQLSATLVLDYPSITSLARFLQEKLFVKSSPAPAAPPAESLKPSHADLVSVAEMNDSETDAALAAELVMIQQKLGVR